MDSKLECFPSTWLWPQVLGKRLQQMDLRYEIAVLINW